MGTIQTFITLRNQPSPVKVRQSIHYDCILMKPRKLVYPPFPSDTKAFLYYFTPPDKPRIAGELRLRVASSDQPESFKSGSDLLGLDGQPWSLSVYAVSKQYSSLYEKLRDEGLVPDDLDAVLSTFPSNPKYRHHNRPLHTLNDTFVVDFSRHLRTLSIVTEQGMEKLQSFLLFTESRSKHTPYTGEFLNTPRSMTSNEFVGSALARFERSTLPDHEGTRTVVLRFLKIITPVKCVTPNYDGYIGEPKEGELYRRARKRKFNQPPVWSLNIDKPARLSLSFRKNRSLRLLWDATDNLYSGTDGLECRQIHAQTAY